MSDEVKNESEVYSPELIPFARDNEEWKSYILTQIQEKNSEELQSYLKELYPADIANLLEEVEIETGLKLFQLMAEELQGEVLDELNEEKHRIYLKHLSPDELVKIITALQSDQAAAMLQELSAEGLSAVLSLTPLDERIKVIELLSYPEDTAGSIMTKEFICVRENDTIKSAITHIRKTYNDVEDYYTVYVIDEKGRYCGHISLKSLIMNAPSKKVKKIIEKEIIPIPLYMDQEEVASFFTRYNFITAPVIDANGIMVGRITADDVMEVIQEEASEDILRMGGHISGDESLAAPLLRDSGKRLVWLCLNLVTAFMAAMVVGYFKDTIGKVVILAALMPVVASLGGNAAGQTMAIIVRNIALGGITVSHAGRAITREFLLGILNGIFMGVLSGMIVYFFMTPERGVELAFGLGVIIALAMFINMLVAALSGAVVPIVLKRIGVDPALASSIFVTTCTDVFGFFVFLGLATLAIYMGYI